nr:ASCH domain-containing protein [uncultured Roseateles sp.]
MPDIPPSVRLFWAEFEASVGGHVAHRFYEATYFDDNEPSANELAQLVLAGVKRATAGLVWSYEMPGETAPKVGDLSVVTDWQGNALCVIETTRIDVVPFDEVDAEFAATEGEGDGSLRYWREAHEAFFARECARIGREPHPQMPVLCERFQVVYRRAAGQPRT